MVAPTTGAVSIVTANHSVAPSLDPTNQSIITLLQKLEDSNKALASRIDRMEQRH